MGLRPLGDKDMAQLRALWEELRAGETVTAARWHELEAVQAHFAAALDITNSGPHNANELFMLVREPGDAPALIAPRWWLHLVGLRHGAVHVILTTPLRCDTSIHMMRQIASSPAIRPILIVSNELSLPPN